jgi:quercetin dioxygenase-like cupin family protein
VAKGRDDGEREVMEALAAAIAPAALEPERRERLRARVRARSRGREPEGSRTVRSGASGWRPFLPLVDVRMLHRDEARGRQTVLYRLHAGAQIPAHVHADAEECLVLEGEVEIGDLRLGAGDYHYAAAGSTHATLSSRPGALLLITQSLVA